eukprot:SAG31_NODE_616_length_13519_cov_2.372876_6_plen_194_part_00
MRDDGVVAYVPRFEIRGNVHLRARTSHAVFVPRPDHSGPAKEDVDVELHHDIVESFDKNGPPGKASLLRACKKAGGAELYRVMMFDHITVRISIATRRDGHSPWRFRVPMLSLRFVGCANKDNEDNSMAAKIPGKGGKPGKKTVANLRTVVLADKEAQKSSARAEAEAKLVSIFLRVCVLCVFWSGTACANKN